MLVGSLQSFEKFEEVLETLLVGKAMKAKAGSAVECDFGVYCGLLIEDFLVEFQYGKKKLPQNKHTFDIRPQHIKIICHAFCEVSKEFETRTGCQLAT